jgi:hypothetical protein
VFSVFNAVLLRPFPYPDADRLATVFEINLKRGGRGLTISPPDFLSWRENTRTLQMTAAYRSWEPNLTGIEQAVRLNGIRVSGDFFTLLGVQPSVGRTLTREDESTRSRTVVVGHDLWRRLFAMDPQTVERSVRLDGDSYVIAGVMPASLQFPSRDVDIWAPLNLDAERNDRGEHSLRVVARLASGFSFEQARSELRGLMVQHEAESDADTADLVSLRDWFVGPGSRRILWFLLGAVSLLLVAACANVANLLLARGSGRARELMIRGPRREQRPPVSSARDRERRAGSHRKIAGLLLAVWSIEGIATLLPGATTFRVSPWTLDWRVVLYTFVVSLAAGLIFGLMPAFRYSSARFNASRTNTASTTFRLRGALLVTQTALAFTLLAGAGLLGRAFLNIWQIDPGFSSEGVTAARITLPNRQPDERRRHSSLRSFGSQRIRSPDRWGRHARPHERGRQHRLHHDRGTRDIER